MFGVHWASWIHWLIVFIKFGTFSTIISFNVTYHSPCLLWKLQLCAYSVQFSCSVVSNSLWPRGLQHARLPCPSLTPGAYSNSCPWNRWCHPTISSSVVPFSSCLQSFLASEFFPKSQFFASGGRSIGVSASASVLSMNIQDWFSLELTGLISLQSKGLSKIFQHHNSKSSVLWCSAFFMAQLSHPYMTTGKTIASTIQTFVNKMMLLLFHMLSRLVIAFLPRSKCLLISWLQSAVILEPKKIKSVTDSTFPPNLFATMWWDWLPWS